MFIEKKFSIPSLNGISDKTIEEHLKLYSGYVKNANYLIDTTKGLEKDNQYQIAELQRRFSFEFDGMRNHELYFEQFEGGKKEINQSSLLFNKLTESYGSFDNFISKIKEVATTRGVGWTILYFDKISNSLILHWIDEQHLGHLAGLDIILALDMWEHSYMLDYAPSEKKKYIDAFFENLNYSIIEDRFSKLV